MTGSVYEKFTQTDMHEVTERLNVPLWDPESPGDRGDEDSMRQRLSLAFK
jgi:hypothetical protein